MPNIASSLGNSESHALIQDTHGSVGLGNFAHHSAIHNSHNTRRTSGRKVEKGLNSGKDTLRKRVSERKNNFNRKK